MKDQWARASRPSRPDNTGETPMPPEQTDPNRLRTRRARERNVPGASGTPRPTWRLWVGRGPPDPPTAKTANVDFGLRPPPMRGRLAVGLCRGAALSYPEGFKVRLRRNGGWGGIACAALRLFAYGLSSAGAFGSRCSTCLTARTTNVDFGFLPSPLRGRPLVGLCRCAALFIPPRSFKFA